MSGPRARREEHDRIAEAVVGLLEAIAADRDPVPMVLRPPDRESLLVVRDAAVRVSATVPVALSELPGEWWAFGDAMVALRQSLYMTVPPSRRGA